MTNKSSRQKILFLYDIDGTIIKLKQYRSKSIFRKCFNELFEIDVAEDLMPNFSGMTDLQIIADICKTANCDEKMVLQNTESLWEKLIGEFQQDSVISNMILLPEIDEMLSYIDSHDDYYLGLVTGNFKQNAYLKLSAYNLHNYFPIGSFGCEYADRNMLPPLAIARANEYWGGGLDNVVFNSENTIILGDAPSDIICAKHNDIFSVAVCTGFHTNEELSIHKPDIIFEDFSNHQSKIELILEAKFNN